MKYTFTGKQTTPEEVIAAEGSAISFPVEIIITASLKKVGNVLEVSFDQEPPEEVKAELAKMLAEKGFEAKEAISR